MVQAWVRRGDGITCATVRLDRVDGVEGEGVVGAAV